MPRCDYKFTTTKAPRNSSLKGGEGLYSRQSILLININMRNKICEVVYIQLVLNHVPELVFNESNILFISMEGWLWCFTFTYTFLGFSAYLSKNNAEFPLQTGLERIKTSDQFQLDISVDIYKKASHSCTFKYARNEGPKVDSSSWQIPYPCLGDFNWVKTGIMVREHLNNFIFFPWRYNASIFWSWKGQSSTASNKMCTQLVVSSLFTYKKTF